MEQPARCTKEPNQSLFPTQIKQSRKNVNKAGDYSFKESNHSGSRGPLCALLLEKLLGLDLERVENAEAAKGAEPGNNQECHEHPKRSGHIC